MLNLSPVSPTRKRGYRSIVRRRQADDTRRRILDATRYLLQAQGYAGMTVEAIAGRAEVSPQTVYAIFKSKTGILTEILDQSSFGGAYEQLVQQVLQASSPEARLQTAAQIARQIHQAQSETFDLLRGAGVVAPELAKLERQRERLRYKREEVMITLLRDAQTLRADLDYQSARDVLWMLTGQDVYRLLVRERGWPPQKYQGWLADTLIHSLLRPNPST